MSNLVSSDVATSGLWRAIIVENISQGIYSVYIPALHRNEMPFKNIENPKEGLLEYDDKGIFTGASLHMTLKDYPKANSCVWQGRTPLSTGDAVWLMFENGDINYPIIMGQIGSNVSEELSGTSSSRISSDIAYGGNNEDYIFERLVAAEYNYAAACGVIANLQAESGVSPNNMQNSYENDNKYGKKYTDETYTADINSGIITGYDFAHDEIGYGLAQWTYWNRKEKLYNMTVASGSNIDDIGKQCDMLISELSSYGIDFNVPNTEEGAKIAADRFCKQFEKPANADYQSEKIRQPNAVKLWAIYKDGPISDQPLTGALADKVNSYIFNNIGEDAKNAIANNGGTQCVDLIVDYLVKVFGLSNPGGNGWDVAAKTAEKFPNSFRYISIADNPNISLQLGDIISYAKGPEKGPGFSSAYGHTAIAISGDANSQRVIDQWAASKKVIDDEYTGRPINGIARPVSQ